MKGIAIRSLVFSAILYIPINLANSQDSQCENLDFSHGNFSNWTGYTWHYTTRLDEPTEIPDTGIVARQHKIIRDTNAYDANTGYALKLIPPGYKYVARLGDSTRESDTIVRNWRQSLRYNLQVDSANALLMLKFAFVAKNLYRHEGPSEHHFHFFILDENGIKRTSCANFEVCASGHVFDNFQWYYPPYSSDIYGDPTIQWLDWTTVTTDLSEFIGETVTLEVLAEDCILPDSSLIGGWYTCFGYAYFTAKCLPLEIKQQNCENETQSKLTAPEGFYWYEWTDTTGKMLSNTRTLTLTDPKEGAEYYCSMTSYLGCQTVLSTKINIPSIKADFSAEFSCDSNLVKFTNASETSKGRLFYTWDFGNGITSGNYNPTICFDSSGFHQVILNVTNSISGCTKKITKTVESFSPLTVGYQGHLTYCPDESTWVKGYGTSNYIWSNGQVSDSIEINEPGGEFWLVATSSDNKCASDTQFFYISEEPDWNFSIEGDTILCIGEISELTAIGAYEQIWNDSTFYPGITVSDSGNYSCIGKNIRGCKKNAAVHVMLAPVPPANFTLSDTIVNSRVNTITASAENIQNIDYTWNMGDGENGLTGPSVTHTYDYTLPGKVYVCELQSTNEFGCTALNSHEISVIPFIPNVFTPNGDDKNELFMEGANLEIFDRYGKQLYKGTGGWDGKYRGQTVDPDTYFYSLYYTYKGEQTHIIKGYLTLLR